MLLREAFLDTVKADFPLCPFISKHLPPLQDTRRKVPLLVLLMSHSPPQDCMPGKESVLPSVLLAMTSRSRCLFNNLIKSGREGNTSPSITEVDSSNSPRLRSPHGAGEARCPQTWWKMGLAGHPAAGQSQ